MFKKFLLSLKQKTLKTKRSKSKRTQSTVFRQEQWTLFKRRKKRLISWYINRLQDTFQKKHKLHFMWGFILCILCIILFLIFWPYLQIQNVYNNVNIERQGNTININQAYGSIDYLEWKNIFLLDTKEIAKRLQKSQPSIQSIQFQSELPNTLNIRLKPYPSVFQSNGYVILANGSVLKSDKQLVSDIPHITLSKNIRDMHIFGNTLDSDDIKNISTLLRQIPKNIPGVVIKNISYFITEQELLISHSSGTIFIFDISSHLWEQVEKLAIFQKEWEDIAQKKYIYIDVRIPGKLFLCGYEEEYNCRKNMTNIYGEDIFTVTSFESQP